MGSVVGSLIGLIIGRIAGHLDKEGDRPLMLMMPHWLPEPPLLPWGSWHTGNASIAISCARHTNDNNPLPLTPRHKDRTMPVHPLRSRPRGGERLFSFASATTRPSHPPPVVEDPKRWGVTTPILDPPPPSHPSPLTTTMSTKKGCLFDDG